MTALRKRLAVVSQHTETEEGMGSFRPAWPKSQNLVKNKQTNHGTKILQPQTNKAIK